MFYKFLNALRDFFLPDICCICGDTTGSFLDKKKILFNNSGKTYQSPYCKNCTRALEKALLTSRASSKNLKIETAFLFDYSHEITKVALHHIKHHECEKCRRFYADIVSPFFLKFGGKDTVISHIPRNRHNFQKFGFDQSREILDFYISSNPSQKHTALFERRNMKNDNVQQKSLGYNSRAENARLSLKLKENINVPENVLLFDDIVTTGASLSAASELLYKNGAKHIKAVTLAATTLNQ